VAALLGCSGGPTDGEAHSVGLLDSPALPTLVADEFRGAAEGCEGRLDGTEEFGITQADALVVAHRGAFPICIDTLEAMSLELEALGATYAADELYSGFYAAIHLSQVEDWATPTSEELPDGSGDASGDPNPQPNGPVRAMADPNPQPNMPTSPAPSMGEPTPTMPGPTVNPGPTPDETEEPETPIVTIPSAGLPGI
jgi:hypothetical protein